MLKIFGYLKRYWASVLAILVLLVVQANCDLALPSYTSDIVDIGIQQGGIDHAAPKEIRAESLEALLLFMDEEDEALIREHYTQNESGSFERTGSSAAELEALDEAFGIPMVLVYQGTASGKLDLVQLKAALQAGLVSKAQLLEMKDQALGSEALSDSMISQIAALYVKEEYGAMGVDLDALQMNYLLVTGGKMLGLSVVMMAAAILIGLLASKTAASVGRDLRETVFRKVISFSSAEIDQFSTASLITRSTNDIQQVQMVVVMLLRMVLYAPILGIGGVIKVSSTRTGMGWIIGVAVGIILALVLVLVSIAMPKFKVMQTLVDRLNLVSREILTGLPVIRAFSREKQEEERFDKANRNLMRTQLFTNRVMTFMMPMMMLTMNVITLGIVWFGAKGVDLGNLQVGDMMAFITYTMQIVMSFLMLTMVSIMLPRAGVAAGRINQVLETEPVLHDPAAPKALGQPKGVVRFEDVSFRFPGADEDALQHISFTAQPGQTTAIIGSTGCGKSTLLNLIPRFYDVTEGRVTVDGMDVREMTQHDLRKILGYVPQRGVLFSGDIESNLKFGGDEITDTQMVRAAEIAQAAEFIEAKPAQYQDSIAQGGTNVSGGQKQRLSIARAIAKSPKVFLFDDSFSALDYKTDVTLRKALNQELGDATVIIVAQRISTILHADQIIVLEDGHIAGIGRHEELLRSCETYQEIARSQLSEKELSENGGKQS